MTQSHTILPNNILLGVNIDHVATLRQARLTRYPDPVEACFVAENNGADGITIHLREDLRHIQVRDVELIQAVLQTRLNLEMAVTDNMIRFAEKIKPQHCCFVPEKREELTTEGGLDVASQIEKIKHAIAALHAHDINVSLFIDPDFKQIDAAKKCGAKTIEIHTGAYADAKTEHDISATLNHIQKAAEYAFSLGLTVNAGHGLHCHNVSSIARIPFFNELNIGHSIVARAVFIGLGQAVKEMKQIMLSARGAQ